MKYINTQQFDHHQPEKIGVLLVNLGTPNAPTSKAVRPYLKQFLSDPRVVEVPRALWYLILNGLILPFRSKKSAEAYQSIWTEAGSPLLCNTQAMSDKLAQKLRTKDIVVDFAMRYGKPSLDLKIDAMLRQGVRKLLVLPLYPQYSATTTASVFDALTDNFQKRRWFPELRFVNQYHDEPSYINGLADKVRHHWSEHGRAQKLVFSFHGIPKMFWEKGDPYVCQCFKTARLLAESLELNKDEIQVCFQSRFGKLEWAKPYLDETLKQLPTQGVESVQVLSPGFAADCLETLEEIAEENRDYFLEAGGKRFEYIPCLNDDASHVSLLENIVDKHIQGWTVTETPELTASLAKAREQQIQNN